MTDIIDPDAPDTPLDPPPLAAPDVPRPLIIDCRGSADVAPHQQAPVVLTLDGHPTLTLHPGVQPVCASTWSAYSSHPGMVARTTAPTDEDGNVTGDACVESLDALPRRLDPLVDLISRTWSDAGLVMLAAHEDVCRPKGRRHAVRLVLGTQTSRVDKRKKPTR